MAKNILGTGLLPLDDIDPAINRNQRARQNYYNNYKIPDELPDSIYSDDVNNIVFGTGHLGKYNYGDRNRLKDFATEAMAGASDSVAGIGRLAGNILLSPESRDELNYDNNTVGNFIRNTFGSKYNNAITTDDDTLRSNFDKNVVKQNNPIEVLDSAYKNIEDASEWRKAGNVLTDGDFILKASGGLAGDIGVAALTGGLTKYAAGTVNAANKANKVVSLLSKRIAKKEAEIATAEAAGDIAKATALNAERTSLIEKLGIASKRAETLAADTKLAARNAKIENLVGKAGVMLSAGSGEAVDAVSNAYQEIFSKYKENPNYIRNSDLWRSIKEANPQASIAEIDEATMQKMADSSYWTNFGASALIAGVGEPFAKNLAGLGSVKGLKGSLGEAALESASEGFDNVVGLVTPKVVQEAYSDEDVYTADEMKKDVLKSFTEGAVAPTPFAGVNTIGQVSGKTLKKAANFAVDKTQDYVNSKLNAKAKEEEDYAEQTLKTHPEYDVVSESINQEANRDPKFFKENFDIDNTIDSPLSKVNKVKSVLDNETDKIKSILDKATDENKNVDTSKLSKEDKEALIKAININTKGIDIIKAFSAFGNTSDEKRFKYIYDNLLEEDPSNVEKLGSFDDFIQSQPKEFLDKIKFYDKNYEDLINNLSNIAKSYFPKSIISNKAFTNYLKNNYGIEGGISALAKTLSEGKDVVGTNVTNNEPVVSSGSAEDILKANANDTSVSMPSPTAKEDNKDSKYPVLKSMGKSWLDSIDKAKNVTEVTSKISSFLSKVTNKLGQSVNTKDRSSFSNFYKYANEITTEARELVKDYKAKFGNENTEFDDIDNALKVLDKIAKTGLEDFSINSETKEFKNPKASLNEHATLSEKYFGIPKSSKTISKPGLFNYMEEYFANGKLSDDSKNNLEKFINSQQRKFDLATKAYNEAVINKNFNSTYEIPGSFGKSLTFKSFQELKDYYQKVTSDHDDFLSASTFMLTDKNIKAKVKNMEQEVSKETSKPEAKEQKIEQPKQEAKQETGTVSKPISKETTTTDSNIDQNIETSKHEVIDDNEVEPIKEDDVIETKVENKSTKVPNVNDAIETSLRNITNTLAGTAERKLTGNIKSLVTLLNPLDTTTNANKVFSVYSDYKTGNKDKAIERFINLFKLSNEQSKANNVSTKDYLTRYNTRNKSQSYLANEWNDLVANIAKENGLNTDEATLANVGRTLADKLLAGLDTIASDWLRFDEVKNKYVIDKSKHRAKDSKNTAPKYLDYKHVLDFKKYNSNNIPDGINSFHYHFASSLDNVVTGSKPVRVSKSKVVLNKESDFDVTTPESIIKANEGLLESLNNKWKTNEVIQNNKGELLARGIPMMRDTNDNGIVVNIFQRLKNSIKFKKENSLNNSIDNTEYTNKEDITKNELTANISKYLASYINKQVIPAFNPDIKTADFNVNGLISLLGQDKDGNIVFPTAVARAIEKSIEYASIEWSKLNFADLKEIEKANEDGYDIVYVKQVNGRISDFQNPKFLRDVLGEDTKSSRIKTKAAQLETGIPVDDLAVELGNHILDTLGISLNNGSDTYAKELFNGLRVSLGRTAIDFLVDQGAMVASTKLLVPLDLNANTSEASKLWNKVAVKPVVSFTHKSHHLNKELGKTKLFTDKDLNEKIKNKDVNISSEEIKNSSNPLAYSLALLPMFSETQAAKDYLHLDDYARENSYITVITDKNSIPKPSPISKLTEKALTALPKDYMSKLITRVLSRTANTVYELQTDKDGNSLYKLIAKNPELENIIYTLGSGIKLNPETNLESVVNAQESRLSMLQKTMEHFKEIFGDGSDWKGIQFKRTFLSNTSRIQMTGTGNPQGDKLGRMLLRQSQDLSNLSGFSHKKGETYKDQLDTAIVDLTNAVNEGTTSIKDLPEDVANRIRFFVGAAQALGFKIDRLTPLNALKQASQYIETHKDGINSLINVLDKAINEETITSAEAKDANEFANFLFNDLGQNAYWAMSYLYSFAQMQNMQSMSKDGKSFVPRTKAEADGISNGHNNLLREFSINPTAQTLKSLQRNGYLLLDDIAGILDTKLADEDLSNLSDKEIATKAQEILDKVNVNATIHYYLNENEVMNYADLTAKEGLAERDTYQAGGNAYRNYILDSFKESIDGLNKLLSVNKRKITVDNFSSIPFTINNILNNPDILESIKGEVTSFLEKNSTKESAPAFAKSLLDNIKSLAVQLLALEVSDGIKGTTEEMEYLQQMKNELLSTMDFEKAKDVFPEVVRNSFKNAHTPKVYGGGRLGITNQFTGSLINVVKTKLNKIYNEIKTGEDNISFEDGIRMLNTIHPIMSMIGLIYKNESNKTIKEYSKTLDSIKHNINQRKDFDKDTLSRFITDMEKLMSSKSTIGSQLLADTTGIGLGKALDKEYNEIFDVAKATLSANEMIFQRYYDELQDRVKEFINDRNLRNKWIKTDSKGLPVKDKDGNYVISDQRGYSFISENEFKKIASSIPDAPNIPTAVSDQTTILNQMYTGLASSLIKKGSGKSLFGDKASIRNIFSDIDKGMAITVERGNKNQAPSGAATLTSSVVPTESLVQALLNEEMLDKGILVDNVFDGAEVYTQNISTVGEAMNKYATLVHLNNNVPNSILSLELNSNYGEELLRDVDIATNNLKNVLSKLEKEYPWLLSKNINEIRNNLLTKTGLTKYAKSNNINYEGSKLAHTGLVRLVNISNFLRKNLNSDFIKQNDSEAYNNMLTMKENLDGFILDILKPYRDIIFAIGNNYSKRASLINNNTLPPELDEYTPFVATEVREKAKKAYIELGTTATNLGGAILNEDVDNIIKYINHLNNLTEFATKNVAIPLLNNFGEQFYDEVLTAKAANLKEVITDVINETTTLNSIIIAGKSATDEVLYRMMPTLTSQFGGTGSHHTYFTNKHVAVLKRWNEFKEKEVNSDLSSKDLLAKFVATDSELRKAYFEEFKRKYNTIIKNAPNKLGTQETVTLKPTGEDSYQLNLKDLLKEIKNTSFTNNTKLDMMNLSNLNLSSHIANNTINSYIQLTGSNSIDIETSDNLKSVAEFNPNNNKFIVSKQFIELNTKDNTVKLNSFMAKTLAHELTHQMVSKTIFDGLNNPKATVARQATFEGLNQLYDATKFSNQIPEVSKAIRNITNQLDNKILKDNTITSNKTNINSEELTKVLEKVSEGFEPVINPNAAEDGFGSSSLLNAFFTRMGVLKHLRNKYLNQFTKEQESLFNKAQGVMLNEALGYMNNDQEFANWLSRYSMEPEIQAKSSESTKFDLIVNKLYGSISRAIKSILKIFGIQTTKDDFNNLGDSYLVRLQLVGKVLSDSRAKNSIHNIKGKEVVTDNIETDPEIELSAYKVGQDTETSINNSDLSPEFKKYLTTINKVITQNIIDNFGDDYINSIAEEYPEEFEKAFNDNTVKEIDNTLVQLRDNNIILTPLEENTFKQLYTVGKMTAQITPDVTRYISVITEGLISSAKLDNFPAGKLKGFSSLVSSLDPVGIVALAASSEQLHNYWNNYLEAESNKVNKNKLLNKAKEWYESGLLFKASNNRLKDVKDIDPKVFDSQLQKIGQLLATTNFRNKISRSEVKAKRIAQLKELKAKRAVTETIRAIGDKVPALEVPAVMLATAGEYLTSGTGVGGKYDTPLGEKVDELFQSIVKLKGSVGLVTSIYQKFRGSNDKIAEIFDLKGQITNNIDVTRSQLYSAVIKNIEDTFLDSKGNPREITQEEDKVVSNMNKIGTQYLDNIESLENILVDNSALDKEITNKKIELAQTINDVFKEYPSNVIKGLINYLYAVIPMQSDMQMKGYTYTAKHLNSSFAGSNIRAIASLNDFFNNVTANPISIAEVSKDNLNKISDVITSLYALHNIERMNQEERNALKDLKVNQPKAYKMINAQIKNILEYSNKVNGENYLGYEGDYNGKQNPFVTYKILDLTKQDQTELYNNLLKTKQWKVHSYVEDKTKVAIYNDSDVSKSLTTGLFNYVNQSNLGANAYNGLPLSFSGLSNFTDSELSKFNTLRKKEFLSNIIKNPNYYDDLVKNGKVTNTRTVSNANGTTEGFMTDLDRAQREALIEPTETGIQSIASGFGRILEELFAIKNNSEIISQLRQIYERAPAKDKDLYIQWNGSSILTATGAKANSPAYLKMAKQLDKLFSSLPAVTKQELKNNPLFINKMLLDNIVGYNSISIFDILDGTTALPTFLATPIRVVLNGLPQILGVPNPRKMYSLLERGLSEIVSSAKKTVLVKSIEVPISNLVSNTLDLITLGLNPKEVSTNILEGYKLAKRFNYDNQQYWRYSQLLANDDKLSSTEKVKYTALMKQHEKNRETNPIYPLFRYGLFTSLEQRSGVEVTDSPYSLGSKINNKLGLDKFKDKTPRIINELLINDGSFADEFLTQALDYGDFVAKYALYKHMTQKLGKDQMEAIRFARDQFINYSINKGAGYDYLDKIGAIWFLTYKLGIQRIILRTFRMNPLRWIGMMSGANAIGLTPVGNSSLLLNPSLDYWTSPSNTIKSFNAHWLAQALSLLR